MSISNEFVDFVIDQLYSWREVIPRRMFGGVGLFAESIMFGAIFNDSLYLKVNDSNINKFKAYGSKALKPFENKKVVLSYYYLPDELLDDEEELISWVEESFQIQNRN